MKLTRTAALAGSPLGLAALLNVVLLLMFFFVLGSSMVLQPGLAVTLPPASFTLSPQVNARLVTLQPGTPPRIFYQEQRVTLEELGRQLSAYRGSPRAIILRADQGTPYGSIMAVTNLALKQDYTVAFATVPMPGKP